MKDEIIAELWQIKDELAREANYDVQVLCRELMERQTTSSAQIVDRSASIMSVSSFSLMNFLGVSGIFV